jgi:hypothetical protein
VIFAPFNSSTVVGFQTLPSFTAASSSNR